MGWNPESPLSEPLLPKMNNPSSILACPPWKGGPLGSARYVTVFGCGVPSHTRDWSSPKVEPLAIACPAACSTVPVTWAKTSPTGAQVISTGAVTTTRDCERSAVEPKVMVTVESAWAADGKSATAVDTHAGTSNTRNSRLDISYPLTIRPHEADSATNPSTRLAPSGARRGTDWNTRH